MGHTWIVIFIHITLVVMLLPPVSAQKELEKDDNILRHTLASILRTFTASASVSQSMKKDVNMYRSHDTENPARIEKRKAVIGQRYRWTNRTIPFQLELGEFTEHQLHELETAFQTYMTESCLTFRPAVPTDVNKLYFKNGPGCSSQSVGMTGGTQTITLSADGCRSLGMYLHELGHAVGLLHEHQLPGREKHIRINWAKVDPTMRKWFDIYNPREAEYYDIPYDVTSVMHYGLKSFSIDGSDTITTIDPEDRKKVGEIYWKLLSFTDVKVLNLMYSCSDHCSSNIPCPHEGFVDKHCKCVTPQSYHDSHCFNRYEREEVCYRFKSIGLCDYTPDWMSKNCRKACGRCPNFGV